MKKRKKTSSKNYIYCFIKKPKHCFNLKNIQGIGGGKIFLKDGNKISAVVSCVEQDDLSLNRKNLFVHEQVIKEMGGIVKAVLPLGFGVVVGKKDALQNIFAEKEACLFEALESAENQIEFCLRAIWLNMRETVNKIISENEELNRFYSKNVGKKISLNDAINAGKLMEKLIYDYKNEIKNKVVSEMADVFIKAEERPVAFDEMIFDLCFLIPFSKKKIFFCRLKKVRAFLKKEKAYFKIIGPTIPFNFSRIKF